MHLALVLALLAPPNQEAESFMREWLEAQNAGTFSDYAALYARKFEGIRRSGPRTFRFDRAGWLRDRKRMFAKPMRVNTQDLRTTSDDRNHLRLRFTQQFAQGNYSDAGGKVMDIARSREDDDWHITREEMLRSDTARPLPPAEFAWVTSGRVVLAADADASWAAGAPAGVVELTEGPAVARRAVDVKRLPAGLAQLAGRKFVLYGERGRVCAGVLKTFVLLARAGGYSEQRDEWTNLPKGDAAAAIFEAATGDRTVVLAGELGPVEGDCAGATFARDAALPAPALARSAKAGRAVRAEAAAELRALPAWKARPELRRSPVTVTMFEGHAERLALAAAETSGVCGDDTVAALLAIPDAGGMTLRADSDHLPAGRLVLAVDLGGDGSLELLFDDGDEQSLWQRAGDAYVRVALLEVHYHGCRC
jgi:hypothetical protein